MKPVRTNHGAMLASALVVGLALTFTVKTAAAETDKRELQAREFFGAGRYQDALDLFVKLYAEKVHPNYLRNIGRCYQNLGEPDKAIGSFREYLRQSKTVHADERREVEGYIKEMEDLKRQRAAEAAALPPPAPPPPPPGQPPPPASGGASSGSPSAAGANGQNGRPLALAISSDPATTAGGPSATLVERPEQLRSGDGVSSPIYTRWWFWTVIGAVVVGGVAVAVATGVFTKTEDAPCITGDCK